MGDVPVLKPREVVAILEKLGFVEARQRAHGAMTRIAPRPLRRHLP